MKIAFRSVSFGRSMKKTWPDRLTTVFVRQGHYAKDQGVVAQYPPADFTIEDIAALLQPDLIATLRDHAKA